MPKEKLRKGRKVAIWVSWYIFFRFKPTKRRPRLLCSSSFDWFKFELKAAEEGKRLDGVMKIRNHMQDKGAVGCIW